MAYDIKLISCDMDGTLFNDDKDFPEGFKEAMDELNKKNIPFIAASGRSYPKQEEIFNDYLDNMYFICDNGALIKHKKQTLYKNTIKLEEIKKIIEECKKIDNIFLVFCGVKGIWQLKTPSEFEKHISSYYKDHKIIEDFDEIDDEILKISICDLDGSANNSFKKLNPIFSSDYTVVVSGEVWMDIMKKGVNKGIALQIIQQKLSIKEEQTMSFGDYYNDIEMLQASKYSFVMENANDDMKQYGKYIAPSNNDNGVIKMINKYIFDKK